MSDIPPKEDELNEVFAASAFDAADAPATKSPSCQPLIHVSTCLLLIQSSWVSGRSAVTQRELLLQTAMTLSHFGMSKLVDPLPPLPPLLSYIAGLPSLRAAKSSPLTPPPSSLTPSPWDPPTSAHA